MTTLDAYAEKRTDTDEQICPNGYAFCPVDNPAGGGELACWPCFQSRRRRMTTCPDCGREFDDEHALATHEGMVHVDVKPWEDEDTLRELYQQQGLTTIAIADKFDCASSTIQSWMRRHGIERRDGGNPPHPTLLDAGGLRRLYHGEGMSIQEIADKLGCVDRTVLNWMEEHGIETRTSTVDKPCHYRTSASGYEEWTHKHGDAQYTFGVHRLVAVAEYGFDAVCGKIVHHENAIPWDNRPSNLALMGASEHSKHHMAERIDKIQFDDQGNIAGWSR